MRLPLLTLIFTFLLPSHDYILLQNNRAVHHQKQIWKLYTDQVPKEVQLEIYSEWLKHANEPPLAYSENKPKPQNIAVLYGRVIIDRVRYGDFSGGYEPTKRDTKFQEIFSELHKKNSHVIEGIKPEYTSSWNEEEGEEYNSFQKQGSAYEFEYTY